VPDPYKYLVILNVDTFPAMDDTFVFTVDTFPAMDDTFIVVVDTFAARRSMPAFNVLGVVEAQIMEVEGM